MAEAEEGLGVADVYASLRALARDEGAHRPDEALLDFLRGDGTALARALRIGLARGPANARWAIVGHLRGEIDQLEVRPGRQDLTAGEREKQYKHAVIVCFNILSPDVAPGRLTERRKWLEDPARGKLKIAESICQKDFDHACKQIAERLTGGDSKTGQTTADAVSGTGSERSTAEATDVNLKRPVFGSVPDGKTRRSVRSLLGRKSVRVALVLVLLGGVVAAASSYLSTGSDLNQSIGNPPGFVDGKPVPEKCQPTLGSLQPGQGNALQVTLSVKTDDTPCWTPIVAPVAFGATFRYMISYQNNSDQDQNNVVAKVSLAPKLLLIPHSTYLFNSTNPNGYLFDSNAITEAGLIIGGYKPGGGGYVVFSASFPAKADLECGTTDIRSVGDIRPENMSWYYNTAITQTFKRC